jgi:hypothetical protein
MKFTEAIAAIQQLEFEGKDAAIAAINKQVKDLPELQKTNETLQTNLNTLLDIAGVTEGNLETKLQTAQTTIKTLKEEKTGFQTQLTAKEGEIKTLKQQTTLTQAAQIAKANPSVLTKLLSDFNGEIKIKGDKVNLIPTDGQAIELAAYVDANLADFKSALFPATTSPSPLPTGGANSKVPEPTDAISAYQTKTYANVLKDLGVADA